jgi:hypothetical protein
MNLPSWIGALAPLAAILYQAALPLVGVWAAHRLTKPRDHERAVLIARIASDAAALAVRLFPNATIDDLIARVVEDLRRASGLTDNQAVLKRAATAAVMEARAGAGPRSAASVKSDARFSP